MARIPNRSAVAEALVARRARAADAFALADSGDALVCLASGTLVPIEGTDAHYRFRAHDDHYYLSGSRRAAGVLVFDPVQADPWTLYAFQADQTERLWHGDTDTLETIAAETGLAQVRPLAELEGALGAAAGRKTAVLGNYDLLMGPAAYDQHPGLFEALDLDADLSDALEYTLHCHRRTKDDVELAWMRVAAAASVAGHEAGMRHVRVGQAELDLRTEIEAAFLRAGGDNVAYGSIVAGGTNAAILHATPGRRTFGADDLVLVDAGAEVAGYDCDITRTYPASGTFTPAQADLYDVVLGVQTKAIEGMRAGTEYRDLHLEAMHGIAQGLVELGVCSGKPEDLVERDTAALFFPHGLGHQIGLATHDVAGFLPDRERSEKPGLKNLRTDLPLEPGYVLTVEPGLYFIDALLDAPDVRAEHGDAIDFDRVDQLRPLGGVRIEDDVHVTDADPEVLTAALPKDRAGIEAYGT